MAEEFYISPGGNDRNPGTKEKPFATLERARDAVRNKVAEGLTENITVYLEEGVWYLNQTLVLGSADSGTEKYSITWKGAEGKEVVISGGRRITDWKEADGGIWKARVPLAGKEEWYFQQLFVNGWRARRAGAPDSGYFRVLKAGPDKRTSFRFAKGDLKDWPGVDKGEVFILTEWCSSRVRIRSVNEKENTVVLADPVGTGHKYNDIEGYRPNNRYRVENIRALLDTPGEWFLDAEAETVLYKPREDESPDRMEVVAPVLGKLIMIKGVTENPVRNVHFHNIIFMHTTRPLHPNGYGGTQACFYFDRSSKRAKKLRMAAAIEMICGKDCGFQNCRFMHFGASGLDFGHGCHRNQVIGCRITDTGANGIMVGAGREAMWKPKGVPRWKAEPDMISRENRIEDCIIETPGQIYPGALGIWVGNAAETVVSHNEIRNTPYTGISVGWVWNDKPAPAAKNIIEYNHIHSVMEVLSDGGGIYTLGRQPETVLRGNLIYDVLSPSARRMGQGIYLDEGSSDMMVEGNGVYGVIHAPFYFHQNRAQNIVRDNLIMMIASRSDAFHLARTSSEHIIRKNNRIVLEKEVSGLIVPEGKHGAALCCLGPGWSYEVPHSSDPREFTLAAWFCVRGTADPIPRSGGGWQESRMWIVSRNGNEWQEAHYGLLVNRSRVGAYLNIGGGKKGCRSLFSSRGLIQTHKWHHLAMTYDGKNMRLYLDGKPAGTLSVNKPRKPGRSPLCIGGRQDGYSPVAFQGKIDEVYLFQRSLSSHEIQALVADPGAIASDRSLAGYWGFDEKLKKKYPEKMEQLRKRAGPRAPWKELLNTAMQDLQDRAGQIHKEKNR